MRTVLLRPYAKILCVGAPAFAIRLAIPKRSLWPENQPQARRPRLHPFARIGLFWPLFLVPGKRLQFLGVR